MPTTLPLPQIGIAPCQEDFLEPTVSSGVKESPVWISSSPSIVGHDWGAPLQSHPTRMTGESARLDPWESDCDGEGGKGLQPPALTSL